jgi:hypothetical protein
MNTQRMAGGFARSGCVLVSRLTLIGASSALLIGWCSECTASALEPYYVQRWLLPGAGLVVGLAICILGYIPRGRPLADALLVISAMVGLFLAAVSSAVSLQPCLLCWIFWGALFVLLVELVFSDRAMVRPATFAISIASVCVIPLIVVQGAQAELAAITPVRSTSERTLLGKVIPRDLGLPTEGIIVLVTDCATCWKGAGEAEGTRLREEGYSVTVVYLDRVANDAERPVPPSSILREEDLLRLGIDPTSPPLVLQVSEGRVIASGHPGRFRPQIIRTGEERHPK